MTYEEILETYLPRSTALARAAIEKVLLEANANQKQGAEAIAMPASAGA